jgi:hypothetical protein
VARFESQVERQRQKHTFSLELDMMTELLDFVHRLEF